jgi:serine/threonine-protein kinase HipA
MRQAHVYRDKEVAGLLSESESGYTFAYSAEYLAQGNAKAISLTLPLSTAKYTSNVLFPYFDGLIPEGWLLDIAQESWKLNERDRFGLLLACCRDSIGAVGVEPSADIALINL